MNNYESIYDPGSVAVTEEKPAVTFTKAERITAILMLLAGFLWIRLCLYHASGVFTTLLYAGIITAQIVCLHRSGVQLTRSEKLTCVVLYVFSLVYTITDNDLLKGLTTVFLALTGCLFLVHVGNPNGDILRYLPVSLAKGLFISPTCKVDTAFRSVCTGTRSKGFWKNAGFVVLGLMLAVPVTFIAGVLLYQADDNMAHLLDSLFQIPSSEVMTLFPHLLIGLVVGSFVFSALYCALHKLHGVHPETCAEMAGNCRIIPTPLLCAMATPLCLLYILFFFSQLQYFLGGFTGDIKGFTYAEYARRGFFELCGVCCMNVVVIGFMGFFAKLHDNRKPLALKLYGAFLCVSSLLLAGTAIAKMFLYIHVYGMTPLRVYTTWFMLLLVIGFTLLLIRQFKESFNLGKVMTVAFTLMFAVLCFSRPDAWMTRYNAEMYLSGALERFDCELLTEMSDDAYAALSHYNDTDLQDLLTDKNYSAVKRFTLRADRTREDFWENTNLPAWELMAWEGTLDGE